MRHNVAGRKLCSSSSHRKSMYRNLVTDLLNYEKIVTTEAKAKEARGLAEKMITLGKKGGLHPRRQALSYILDKKVADKVFAAEENVTSPAEVVERIGVMSLYPPPSLI